MGLFGKKKKGTPPPCCGRTPETAALAELGVDTAIEHVTDFMQIAAYGVMTTPALVVGGRVVSCGRVPGQAELREMLREALEKETLEQGPAV